MTDFEKQDKSFWEGFNCAKNKMEKRVAELNKENDELREKIRQLELIRDNNDFYKIGYKRGQYDINQKHITSE